MSSVAMTTHLGSKGIDSMSIFHTINQKVDLFYDTI